MARDPIINTPSDMPNSGDKGALCCRDFNKRITKRKISAATMYINWKKGMSMANNIKNSRYLKDMSLQTLTDINIKGFRQPQKTNNLSYKYY